jgi:arsenate reductase
MPEALLYSLSGDSIEAESVGITPGNLSPIAVRVMPEIGIDISTNWTKDVLDFVKQGRRFPYVITVCDQASGERCPIFAGILQRLHWSFPDPSAFKGTDEEIVSMTRQVRDQIRERTIGWLPTVQTDR